MPSSQKGSVVAPRRHGLTLDECDVQIKADHAEGKEKITLTRASARALYYALWDTLYAESPREHESHDIARLERMHSRLSSIGWPLPDEESR